MKINSSIELKTAEDKDCFLGLEMLIVLLCCVSAVLAFLVLTQKPKNAPPLAKMGLPIVGAAGEYGKNPIVFLKKCRDKYGPVFEVNVIVMRFVFVLGNKGVNFFFSHQDKDLSFSQAAAYPLFHILDEASFLDDAWYQTAVSTITAGFLSQTRLRMYQQCMIVEINRMCDFVSSGKPIEIFKSASKMITLANLRVILGDDACDQHGDHLAEEFFWLEHKAFTAQMMLLRRFTFLPFVRELKRRRKHLLDILSSIASQAHQDLQNGKQRNDYVTLVVQRHGTDSPWEKYALQFLALLLAAHTNSALSVVVFFFWGHLTHSFSLDHRFIQLSWLDFVSSGA